MSTRAHGEHESGVHGMDGKFWRTLAAGTTSEKEFEEEEAEEKNFMTACNVNIVFLYVRASLLLGSSVLS